MADYYLDHLAYGSSNVLGLNTPTWGVPQEGDGTSMSVASSSSVGQIVLANNPTTGQTFSFMTMTFTAGASMTNTVFVIGASIDATCNNIATMINSSTTGTTFGAANTTMPLKGFVYARGPALGAPAGTVQIMTRIGSAALNQANNSNMTITSTFTGATITQFAGGVGGCFGYIMNDVNWFGGTVTVGGYGLFGATWWTPNAAGTSYLAIGPSDTIWVRTANGQSFNPTLPSNGVLGGKNCRVIFDTNTKWTSDTGLGTIALNFPNSGNGFNFAGKWIALRRGGFKISANANCQPQMGSTSGVPGYGEGITFTDNSSSAGTAGIQFAASTTVINNTAWTPLTFVNCDYTKTAGLTTLPPMFNMQGGVLQQRVRFENCTFTYTITGTSDPGPLFAWVTPPSANLLPWGVHLINCKFTANGYAGGLTLFPSGQPSWVNSLVTAEIRIENCTGLRLPTAASGLPSTSVFPDQDYQSFYINLGTSGFRYENKRGLIDWVPSDVPPTLTAKLPDGTTSWSMRCLWMTIPNPTYPLSFPLFRCFNRLTAATRTVTMELLVPTALTVSDFMLRMSVYYTSSSGTQYTEFTQSVVSSTASWTNVPAGFTAKKLTITTANAIAAGSEVGARVEIFNPPSSGSNAYIYLNPEPSIT